MDLRPLITDYLSAAKLMQVAPASEEQPWACSVYFAFDEKLNLYWISKPGRRHSQEITKNSKVAGTIVLPHTPGDDVRGIQFQGTAKELLAQPEIKKAMEYYGQRFNMTADRIQKIVDGTDGHHVYKISPSLIVLFDEVNFPDDPRQELKL